MFKLKTFTAATTGIQENVNVAQKLASYLEPRRGISSGNELVLMHTTTLHPDESDIDGYQLSHEHTVTWPVNSSHRSLEHYIIAIY